MKTVRVPPSGRRRLLILAASLLVISGLLQARVVTLPEARTAAIHLVAMENFRPDLRLTPGPFSPGAVQALTSQGQTIGYLMELHPQGFMILSAETEAVPEVFVSFSGDFASLEGHSLWAGILSYLKDGGDRSDFSRDSASRGGRTDREAGLRAADIERHERLWGILLGTQAGFSSYILTSLTEEEVPPLLTSHWKQNFPYNLYTPLVGGSRTLAGCVAVAMAQVMNYWECPRQGQGHHSYTWKGQTLSADFDHAYDWGWMLDSYDSGYTLAQAQAVGRLVSDVGISVDTYYGTEASSGEVNGNNALVNFFKYSPDLHFVMRFSFPDWVSWFEVFKSQMDIRRPVVLLTQTPDYSKGHALVVDGYRTSPSDQVHVNMGWGENYDCYCSVEDMHGYGSESDWALVDIHPTILTLTIRSDVSRGSTDPEPGIYDKNWESEATVTALPNPHYELREWSGDASGTDNPLRVVMDRNRKITADFQRIIYAPLDAAGQKVLNRSLSQAEYINVLTFQAHPDNVDITGYRIYLVEDGQRTELATLGADTFEYRHRGVFRDKVYVYEIVAVNTEPREGHPATVVVQ
jgi:hypothetical protein